MAYRGIADSVGHSESLAALSDTAERLYWRLLAHSDPHGRIPGSPAKTRAICFPLLTLWTHEQVGHALAELEKVGRATVYDADGQAVIQITAFDENQPPEFIRRRGKPRLPESPTLNSGLRTEYSGTLYELPAKPNDSRTTPEQVGSSPAPKQGKARQVLTPTAALHARDTETDAAALNILLDQLDAGPALRTTAHREPDRAIACARTAIERATNNPAGLFRTLLESGEYPTTIQTKKPLADTAALELLIRNGAIQDTELLEIEIAERTLNDVDAQRLRQMLTTRGEAA